jgi:hypothetical protein
MGYIVTGQTANAAVIVALVKKVFGATKNQVDVNRQYPVFEKALTDLGVTMSPLPGQKVQMVWHKKLGGVVDGVCFRFPDKPKTPPTASVIVPMAVTTQSSPATPKKLPAIRDASVPKRGSP